MTIDFLYNQLHELVETVRFSGRLVLAMGASVNIEKMSNYLRCYGISIGGRLDNNPRLWGTWSSGLKIYKPEDVLVPFKDKALIIIFSPKYGKQMGEQLCKLGYKEGIHFFIINDYGNNNESWDAFEEGEEQVKNAYKLYNNIMDKYGSDATIFLLRGATGDVFLNGLYIKKYAEKKGIRNYVLVGDAKGLKKIADLFGFTQVESLSYWDAEYIQLCFRFLGLKNIKDVFMWQMSLYLNRCQTRMHSPFTFLDTYTHYIYEDMVSIDEWSKPDFCNLTSELKQKYDNLGIVPQKTVIVSPYAYSVKTLPVWFWDRLACKLKEKGYQVFVSINDQNELNVFDNMKTIFFPYEESKAVLEYAGYFLGLRSGLCDIVALVEGCRQIVLYPEEMNPIDYKVHRSDMIYSGFKTMGFISEHISEISSKLIKDIVANDEVMSIVEQVELYNKLEEDILMEF